MNSKILTVDIVSQPDAFYVFLPSPICLLSSPNCLQDFKTSCSTYGVFVVVVVVAVVCVVCLSHHKVIRKFK